MNKYQKKTVIWGLLVIAAVLHFSFIDWTASYRPQNEKVIMGFDDSIGIYSRTDQSGTTEILLGLILPLVLVTASKVIIGLSLVQIFDDLFLCPPPASAKKQNHSSKSAADADRANED